MTSAPRRTTRDRVYLGIAASIGGLLVLAVLWIVVTGLVARAQLQGVRTSITSYQDALGKGQVEKAQSIGDDIARRAGSAHQLTSGPAWWVGSNVLGVGTPLRTARVSALAADRLARGTVRQAPALLRDVTGQRASVGRVDVARLARAGTELDRIRATVRTQTAVIAGTAPSWFGPVSGGRRDLLRKLTSVDGKLGTANRAVRTLLPMLGADRSQRYFIGFMNEAESRSLGGLPGAFAIVTVDHGRVRFEHFGSDGELTGVRADVDLGAQYRALYGQDDPTGTIQNSTISPNFPDAARIWAGMWQAKTGERVDGALTLDPSALSALLRATGPTRLADGTPISAANIVSLSESKQYVRFPGFDAADAAKRKQFLASIARAVSAKLLGAGSAADLVPALRAGADNRRIMVWSAQPALERNLLGFGVAGVLQPGEAPFSAFFVNNATGGKMDFYLRRAMTYRTRGCGAGRVATATLTLLNDSPSYSLPSYVTYVSGGRPPGAAVGFSRVILGYYATPGAVVTSVTVDGKRAVVASTTEGALTTVRMSVDLPARARRTIAVTVTEPATTGALQVVRQPLAQPLRVRVAPDNCPDAGAAPTASSNGTVSWWLYLLLAVVVLAGLLAAARLHRVRRRPSVTLDDADSDPGPDADAR